MSAAAEVDVADAVAFMHQLLDGRVSDVTAVTEMDIMQVLSEAGDGVNRVVGNVPTLGEHEVAESRRNIDDLLHSTIGQADARC